jgi:hypothetical protein
MRDAVLLFISGLGGVFLGMALLYTSIRITSLLTEKMDPKKDGK